MIFCWLFLGNTYENDIVMKKKAIRYQYDFEVHNRLS